MDEYEWAFEGFMTLLEDYAGMDEYAMAAATHEYASWMINEMGWDEGDVRQALEDACENSGLDAEMLFNAEP